MSVLTLPTPASLPHNLLSVKNSPSAALVVTWTHRDRQDQGLIGAEQRGDWVAGYPLVTGGVLQHQRQQGVLRRIERSGREVARAKVPAVTREFQSINLVLSIDHSRVLVIFEDSDDSATRAKHRMILLQTATLREVAVIRHGLCNNVAHEEFPQSAETLTLVCYSARMADAGSRPSEPHRDRHRPATAVSCQLGAMPAGGNALVRGLCYRPRVRVEARNSSHCSRRIRFIRFDRRMTSPERL